MSINKEQFVLNMCDSLKDMMLEKLNAANGKDIKGQDLFKMYFDIVKDVNDIYSSVNY